MVHQYCRALGEEKRGGKCYHFNNLSSHLSEKVTNQCSEMNSAFVLLPNSTDKCQPLDVRFFGPLKREWRKLLEAFKIKYPSSSSQDKSLFPQMLMQLMDAINEDGRASKNLISGFRTCGIYSLDAEKILRKFPPIDSQEKTNMTTVISNSVIIYLQQFKYSPQAQLQPRKKEKSVGLPGKVIYYGGFAAKLPSTKLW